MKFGTGSNAERTLTLRIFVFTPRSTPSQNDIHTSKHNWRASVASETLTGVKMKKSGMFVYLFIYIYVWTYVCHFVL